MGPGLRLLLSPCFPPRSPPYLLGIAVPGRETGRGYLTTAAALAAGWDIQREDGSPARGDSERPAEPDNPDRGTLLWLGIIGLATTLAAGIRRIARRVEPRLSDVTGLRFVSAFAQLLAYLVGFVLYAHLIPELRALGTALLAGVSVVSVVVGLAAQNTLGNLIAGLSLVPYRPIRVGDSVQLNSPKGLVTATVELVSLGFTVLRDAEKNEIIVPNSVMVGSIVIRLGQAGVSPGRAENAPPAEAAQ